MRNNTFHNFHIFIISLFILFSGCGYKKPPVYIEDISTHNNTVSYMNSNIKIVQ